MNQYQLHSIRALIERVPGDSPASAKVTAILTTLEKEAIGIANLAKTEDPMASAAANTMIMNQQKDRLRDLAAKARGELSVIILAAKSSFDAARVQKGRLEPDAFAAEIRSVFRGLSSTEKAQFILSATKALDGHAIAAIVTAPAVLTGLTAEQIAGYREHFLDAISPGSKAERDTAAELQNVCEITMGVIDQIGAPKGTAQFIRA